MFKINGYINTYNNKHFVNCIVCIWIHWHTGLKDFEFDFLCVIKAISFVWEKGASAVNKDNLSTEALKKEGKRRETQSIF